ncbi:MAG: hypothetical protein JXI33_01940 [Candidatus Aminicenantes bacterium]|nr:hypothetical protein [Candidatus Aminicenantes bacterium]
MFFLTGARYRNGESPFCRGVGNQDFRVQKLLSLAMPQEIEFVPGLLKARSGKIMRRVLRARERGEETGDISTLEND